MENTQTAEMPLTPDYDRAPQPEPQQEPAQPVEQPEPEPEPDLQSEVKSLRKQLKASRDTSRVQKQRDQKLLDAQLRVESLRAFIKREKLWTAFLAQHGWW